MKISTNKNSGLISYFDKYDETRNGIKGSLLKEILFHYHAKIADNGKIEGLLP